MIKVGDTVKFQFGKQPASAEHKRMAARRSSNMLEHIRIENENKAIIWEPLYCVDAVYKVEGEYVYVGNPKDGGYRFKASEVEVIK